MRRLAIAVAAGLVALAPPQTSAAGIGDDVELAITPADATVTLGENIDITIEVTNTGTTATPPLVIHLDITDPAGTGSVDPEDWTSTLSQQIGTLEPGDTRSVDWQIQPISGGSFALYAVALAPGEQELAVTAVTKIEVIDRRSLNPNGILPVSIAVPGVVGVILISRVRLRRAGSGRARRTGRRRSANP